MINQTLQIHLSKIEHRGETRIKVTFSKNYSLINKIKSIDGRKWSQSKRCWHVPYSMVSFKSLQNLFGDDLQYSNSKAKENNSQLGAIIPNLENYVYKGESRRRFIGEKILIQKLSDKSIAVYIPYSKTNWINIIRGLNGRRWNVEETCWELPYVKSTFKNIKKHIGLNQVILDLEIKKDIPDHADQDHNRFYINKKKNTKKKLNRIEQLSQEQRKALIQIEEYFTLKQYSYSTIRAYRNHLVSLFLFCDKVNPTELKPKDVRAYLLHQIKFKKISASTQNQVINAYKAYCEKILGQPKIYIEIPRPKKPKKLPNVLSQEEVKKLVMTPENLKHKLILLLIYSSGLRLKEVVNLSITDMNLNRKTLHIKAAKGKKDRIVSMASKVIPIAEEYLISYTPTYWLFEGYYGNQYSVRSVQSVFHKALEKSKVNAYATVHTLRHSFATHCVENGYSIGLLQKALGHNSIKTTEIYLHLSEQEIAKLKSPLDNFDL